MLSLEVFWREAGQLFLKDRTFKGNLLLVQSYRHMVVEAGLPFEIIDGDNFYFPKEFLLEVFYQQLQGR